MARALFLFLLLLAGARAGDAVILLHGPARTSRSLDRMEAAFAAAGYVVLNVDYPSRSTSWCTCRTRSS